MSVKFYGWEVMYDDDQHLQAEQEPKSGRLYTMYHGTKVQVARNIIRDGFRQSADGMLGPGVYVSRNQKKAERYPLNSPVTDRVVLKLRVDVGKVKRIDTDNHPLQKSWHSQGYDTAWVPPNCGMRAVPSGLEEDCVWDPKRVEVVDIALAPNTNILAELQGLIAQKQQQQANAGSTGQTAGAACQVCKKKMLLPHTVQACWGCGENICTLTAKHFCSFRG
ncbi:grass carp reovirus (GCRV)-induced gene 2p [Megalops cyprinoides]|uniref:grass carp reovirus (GCRV)-induced gene 2p n=1 Tax=Megalops cyprinoides TaxID=118141 RepID=UPI0018655A0E|nr:grass carp reovirus (GCRV)-induced gene 2p [Megalops cyprinoides]